MKYLKDPTSGIMPSSFDLYIFIPVSHRTTKSMPKHAQKVFKSFTAFGQDPKKNPGITKTIENSVLIFLIYRNSHYFHIGINNI